MLKIHYSNRLTALADELIARLARHDEPLFSQPVGLPSRLLGRWLSLRMARAYGVAANHDFRLHAELVWDCLRRLSPELERDNRFAPGNLRWTIFTALAELPQTPEFAAPRRYMERLDGRGRLAFSQQLATLFDRYLVYRPEMIRQWEAGQADSWQGLLWQRLALPHRLHWANLSEDCFIDTPRQLIAELPPELHLFAMPAFSPSFLSVLHKLGQWCDVHLYQWNPTPEYWATVTSPRRQTEPQLELHFEPEQNSLLASWAQQLRDCFELTVEHIDDPQEHYVEQFSDSLLGNIQRRIFGLEELQAADLRADDSLRIYSCHSRRREVEVCHDHLLQCVASDPTLVPEDILVVAANLDHYAPYVNAVFTSAPVDRRLPVQLVGARALEGDAMLAVRLLLQAFGTGIGAPQLLELLRCHPVRQRLDLHTGDYAIIARWLDQAGLYRGPAVDRNDEKYSWLAVARRLLVSVLIAESDQLHRAPWVPILDVRLGELTLLGKVVEVLNLLHQAAGQAQSARPMSAWQSWLNSLLAGLMTLDRECNEQLTALRLSLTELVSQSRLAQFNQALSLGEFSDVLEGEIDAAGAASHFASSGGVRFCSASVGRLLPAKVIYVLGMSDGVFPRQLETSDLDLMQRRWVVGDRSARDDDRQLFLEWLATAQHQLVLSYVGRSPQDNSPLAPSPLLDELLAYLDDRNAEAAPDRSGSESVAKHSVAKRLITAYPLHPFAAQFPNGDRYSTFAAQYAHQPEPIAAKPLIDRKPVALPHESIVQLEQLQRFFVNPAKYFLRDCLDLALVELREDDERPPISLTALSAYQLRQLLLNQAAGPDAESSESALLEWLRQRPEVADGALGAAALRKLVDDYLQIARSVTSPSQWLPVDLELDATVAGQSVAVRLRGEIDPPADGHRRLLHPAKLSDKHRLRAWIGHLVASTLCGAVCSELHAVDKAVQFAAVDRPSQLLQSLCEIFAQGQQQALVLPPATARAYAQAHTNAVAKALPGSAGESAREAAKRAYVNGRAGLRDSDNEWNTMAAREHGWLTPRFEQAALEVWQPLLAHEVLLDG